MDSAYKHQEKNQQKIKFQIGIHPTKNRDPTPDGKNVLALLRMKDDEGKSIVCGYRWLQKMRYIASRAHPELECHNFKPYKYGMYSSRLKSILNGLKKDGPISMN